MKEMVEMRKTFGAVKAPMAQQNTTVQKATRPSYSQAAGGPPSNSSFRPRVPNGQAAGGYRRAGPHQLSYVPRESMQCFKCRQWGHIAPYCPTNPGMAAATTVTRPPMADGVPNGAAGDVVNGGQSRVQQAVNLKELRNVYVPIRLFNRKMSALLDTGCDTSIIGGRLLPPGTHIEPTLCTLTATNGTPRSRQGDIQDWSAGAQHSCSRDEGNP